MRGYPFPWNQTMRMAATISDSLFSIANNHTKRLKWSLICTFVFAIRITSEIHKVDGEALQAEFADDGLYRWLPLAWSRQLTLSTLIENPINILLADTIVVLTTILVYFVNPYSRVSGIED